MSGNAWEYLILLRCSLLAEVEPQNNEDGDFDGNLKNSLSTYWGMFTSGLTEQRVQCMLCKGVTEQHNTFDDLILNFEQSHHVDNHKNNRCTLGEMLTYYSKNQDDILDYECVIAIRGREQCNDITYVVIPRSYASFYAAIDTTETQEH